MDRSYEIIGRPAVVDKPLENVYRKLRHLATANSLRLVEADPPHMLYASALMVRKTAARNGSNPDGYAGCMMEAMQHSPDFNTELGSLECWTSPREWMRSKYPRNPTDTFKIGMYVDSVDDDKNTYHQNDVLLGEYCLVRTLFDRGSRQNTERVWGMDVVLGTLVMPEGSPLSPELFVRFAKQQERLQLPGQVSLGRVQAIPFNHWSYPPVGGSSDRLV